MKQENIIEKMQELEEKLKYKFKNINFLSKAMNATIIKAKNYENSALATLGDSILKAILSLHFYEDNITMAELTDRKKKLERNKTLHFYVCETKIIDYAYNDKHFKYEKNVPSHERVFSSKHCPYLEAIIAAIYLDSGSFENTKSWVEKNYINFFKNSD